MSMRVSNRLAVDAPKPDGCKRTVTGGRGARWKSNVVRALVATSAITYFGGERQFLDIWSNSGSFWLAEMVLPLWLVTAVGAPIWTWARLLRSRSDESHVLLAVDVLVCMTWTIVFFGTMAWAGMSTIWL